MLYTCFVFTGLAAAGHLSEKVAGVLGLSFSFIFVRF